MVRRPTRAMATRAPPPASTHRPDTTIRATFEPVKGSSPDASTAAASGWVWTVPRTSAAVVGGVVVGGVVVVGVVLVGELGVVVEVVDVDVVVDDDEVVVDDVEVVDDEVVVLGVVVEVVVDVLDEVVAVVGTTPAQVWLRVKFAGVPEPL